MMELLLGFNLTSDVENSFNSTVASGSMTPAVVLGLCCFVGLPSNIAVIISIAREWNRNLSFTFKLILNLAVSDALTLCLAPFVMYGILFGWTLGLWSCRILYFLGHWSLYVGVLTVTAVSLHRYHNIIKSKITNRMILQRLEENRRWIQLIAIWVVAFVFSLPVFFTQVLKDTNGLLRCQRSIEPQSVLLTVLLLEILLAFVLPFSIMVTCYLWLNKGLSQIAKSSRASRCLRDQMFRNKGEKVGGYKKRLVISIVVTFFLFWTPVHIINVIDIVTTLTRTSHPSVYDQLKSFRRIIGDTSKTLTLINCCLNPILYVVFSENVIKCHK